MEAERKLHRASGAVRLTCRSEGKRSTLFRHYQKGSLKTLFPKSGNCHFDAVLLNTAGGVADGDQFQVNLDVKNGAHMRVTSQAAERIYGAQGAAMGEMDITASLADGARLDWLPQETILFDGGRLRRRLDISMNETSELLCVEPLVFGRVAMGERIQSGFLSDQWRVKRGGKLVFADALRLSGRIDQYLQDPAIGFGSGAMSSVLFISPQAEMRLNRTREILSDQGGASLIRSGVLFARVMAQDSYLLRKTLIPLIEFLSDGPIPKTWSL